jgi:hypothetical protein
VQKLGEPFREMPEAKRKTGDPGVVIRETFFPEGSIIWQNYSKQRFKYCEIRFIYEPQKRNYKVDSDKNIVYNLYIQGVKGQF